MNNRSFRADKYSMIRALITIFGIAVNVLFGFLAHRFGLPFYFDTFGTVLVSCLCGGLSGIVTAVATSVLSGLFNDLSIYYSLIAIIIALVTSRFVHKEKYKKKINILFLILIVTAVSGIMGTGIQWILIKGPQFDYVARTAGIMAGRSGYGFFLASMLLNLALNLVDKTVTILAALLLIAFIPRDIREGVRNSIWRQKPLTDPEIKELSAFGHSGRRSISFRLTFMLTVGSLILVSGIVFISLSQYSESVAAQYSNAGRNVAVAAASDLDPSMIETFIRRGESAPEYSETKRRLYEIRDNAYGVEYLYVVRPEETGFRVVFDLDSEEVEGDRAGELWYYDEEELPFADSFLAGEEIPPVKLRTGDGLMFSLYYPVRDSGGRTCCYVGVDLSMDSFSVYVREYLIKVFLVFSGFYILIVGFGLWISGQYLAYPIGSMASMIDGFSVGDEEQRVLDENVRSLRSLNIHTDDEVEKLYRAVCDMASGETEQMRSIRYFADATSKMQNGLIITMADLVENRDSDTGAHIQKTAAYVKIIAEGLKRKGYYPEKLTPKFMSDVVMSAPLHDVGKINISDTVLNKPGKLTDEEFAIMKTHTTAGRDIMEKAISTVGGENYLKEARNMAAYHHERWDGKGYPEGLHGQVIPLSARIMAVADVFDALVSPRVYKPAFPLDKALQIIEEGAGTQFDPKCVEVFMESLPEIKRVMKKYQED